MDIGRLRAEIKARADDALSRRWRLWQRTDIPEPDYSRAQELGLPLVLIERAKRHPSEWIADAAESLYDKIKA